MDGSLAELARKQWADYLAHQPGTCFGDSAFTLTLRQAYGLQDAVAALRVASGDEVAGYKVGCTGPGTVEQFGMKGPIRGCLYQSEIRRSGEALRSSEFACPAIEGEMALKIGDKGEILAAFPVIELHNFVFRRSRKTLEELVANNGLNAGIVLPRDEWISRQTYDHSEELTVRINGKTQGIGGLWPLAAGAAASFEWLRSHLKELGVAILPGQIVLTGTALDLYPVLAGDHVSVFVGDKLAVHCSIR